VIASLLKLIFLFLVIYIFFNIIRFAMGIAKAAGRVRKDLADMERKNRNERESESNGSSSGLPKTIELGKDQYRVK